MKIGELLDAHRKKVGPGKPFQLARSFKQYIEILTWLQPVFLDLHRRPDAWQAKDARKEPSASPSRA
jgi:hypothetical protein